MTVLRCDSTDSVVALSIVVTRDYLPPRPIIQPGTRSVLAFSRIHIQRGTTYKPFHPDSMDTGSISSEYSVSGVVYYI